MTEMTFEMGLREGERERQSEERERKRESPGAGCSLFYIHLRARRCGFPATLRVLRGSVGRLLVM